MSRILRIFALCLLGALHAGCDAPPRTELSVLAGSELKDLEPLLPELRKATGVQLSLHYIGTLDGAEKIVAGQSYDAAWFSHGKYLTLLQGAQRRIVAQEKIMLSPVVLGVKQSLARAWGWTDRPVTWRDIAAKAAAGELRFAMTNPAASNSGFTALVGVTAAFADRGDAITPADIDNRAITDFFRGQQLTAGSSGWLAEAYVEQQDQLGGIVNYESVLLQLNSGGQLREPLQLVYPVEGIITADYPLMLLNGGQREAYDRVVAWLRSPEVQTRLMNETQRRPVNPQVRLSPVFGDDLLIELPFPDRLETIDAILFAYLDLHRRPSHAFFVLDVSGSMTGSRIEQLRQAMNNLTGLDPTLTGRFARFRSREKVTLITFSSGVQEVREFDIMDPAQDAPVMVEIRRFVDDLKTTGGTAIYTALQHAYQMAAEARRQDPERFYSVVLMSDGANNQGLAPAGFENYYQGLPPEVRAIKTFPVVFGDADDVEMQGLARLTGGRVFDGRSALGAAFKTIRGYQ